MITPLVATLVGVRGVSVTPLDCAGPNACDIVSVYTSIFWIAMVRYCANWAGGISC